MAQTRANQISGLYHRALTQDPADRDRFSMTRVATTKRAPFTYEVRHFDSATGQSRVVHRVRLAQVVPGLTVTPDGKTVVIQGVAVVTQDLVRIENFR